MKSFCFLLHSLYLYKSVTDHTALHCMINLVMVSSHDSETFFSPYRIH